MDNFEYAAFIAALVAGLAAAAAGFAVLVFVIWWALFRAGPIIRAGLEKQAEGAHLATLKVAATFEAALATVTKECREERHQRDAEHREERREREEFFLRELAAARAQAEKK